MRMVTATVIAVAVLGVCAAWCCGRDAGWKQAADAYAARNGNYERLVWAMANQAKDLEEGLADVTVCADLLYRSAEDTDVVDPGEILIIIDRKRARLKERMGAAENEKSDCD